MTIGDRERLLRRIRQIRRSTADREQKEAAPVEPSEDSIRALERRMEHLEHLLEGLQDSVHREFERHDELIARLQNEIEPAALGASLAEDARNRGL
jgi:predicted transcriptional regulator